VAKLRTQSSFMGDYANAFLAGTAGALAMSALFALARIIKITNLNFELVLGSLFTGGLNSFNLLIGFSWHVANGGLIGILYAWLFKNIGRADWITGTATGAVHCVFAGFFLGILPSIHPLMPEIIPAPGYFGYDGGIIDAVLLLISHLVYGGITGHLYEKYSESAIVPVPSFNQLSPLRP